jgi:hypothetical protein
MGVLVQLARQAQEEERGRGLLVHREQQLGLREQLRAQEGGRGLLVVQREQRLREQLRGEQRQLVLRQEALLEVLVGVRQRRGRVPELLQLGLVELQEEERELVLSD